ncbi:4-hydroxy-tetrahydrodipicolinate synthase [Thermoleophilia bacterium SCSIO 60948]|nr:4-hydroxy-tetrahydrodipicolinate synthase [Thermoleophilia bacterium SCSIO 60948]
MVTPFDADGEVDLACAGRLATHLIRNGSDGLVVAGTTGESPTLSDDETVRLAETVLGAVGDETTVIVGTGSNDTRHAVHLTERVTALGVDGVLVVTPYYNKPSPAGIRAHFGAVAEAAGETPIIVYNIPGRCVINIELDQLAALAAEFDPIVALKQANNDDLAPVEGMDLLAGNDEIFLETLRLGGTGGILVASHLVGAEMRRVLELEAAGDSAAADELNARIAPVYAAMSVTTNPTPVKAGLELDGVIEAHTRLPIVAATDAERAVVAQALAQARGEGS